MTTAMYAVDGIICESCKAAVLEHVQSLSGVSVAAMDLVTGGQSPLIVTSGTKLGPDAVRDAVAYVGFGVLSPSGRDVRDRGNSSPIRDSDPRLGRLQLVSPMEGMSS